MNLEPKGIMPRQSDTRLGVDNHALRYRVKRLRDVLSRVIAESDAGRPIQPELRKEAGELLHVTSASDVLDRLWDV